MNSEERRNHDATFVRQGDESGISPEHRIIRSTLLNLPRMSCPVGFEFRLQQQLSGRAVNRHTSNNAWNWVTGLTAGGLGLAAALSVAVFVFDFTPWQGGVTGTSQMATRTTATEAAPNYVLPQVVSGQASFTGSPERVLATDTQEKDALTAAVKDSTPESRRVALPEGHYSVVDGSGR